MALPKTNGIHTAKLPDDLEALGKQCLELAVKLKTYLSENGHPQPSFAQDGPDAYPDLNPTMENVRVELREAAKTLYELASDPEDLVTAYPFAKIHDLNAFTYVSRYGVVNYVPVQGSISYADLATKTGTGICQLKKALRQLMTLHVFFEPEPNHVAHTAASKRLLVRGVNLSNGFLCSQTFKIAPFQTDAIDKWGNDCSKENQTAHNLVNKTDKNVFEYFKETSTNADDFAELMAYIFHSSSRVHKQLLHSYDWASLGSVKMVDVGGSTGHCSVIVALANPSMTFVVQDLPHVVASASNTETTTVPLELRERISFMAHDFMQPQPVIADIYFLRMVLHDWSDPACEKILALTATAMAQRPGSRLLVVDSVLPPSGVWPTVLERPARTMDLQMGLVHNGKERHIDEWADLFSRADKRLVINRVVNAPRSVLAIIEVFLKEEQV